MRILTLVLLLGGCSLLTVPPPATPTPPPAVSAVERVLEATVALEHPDGQSFCTGAFASGYVVTAAHCVDDAGADAVILRLRNGERGEARVSRLDPDTDVAVLALTSVIADRAELPLAPAEAAAGDRVFVVGMPLGWRWFLTQGISSGVHDCALDSLTCRGLAGTWLLHSAATSYGNSGGPVLNEYGELVGITSWVKTVYGVPNHMSAAAPLAAIRRALNP